jgi:hypothetical protein
MSAVARSNPKARAFALAALAGWIGCSLVLGCSDPFTDCAGCCTGEGCGFEAPPPTSLACVDAPARDEGVVLVIGRRQGDTFTPFLEGQSVGIDFGGQGGQHFYFAAQVLGAPEGASFFARYESSSTSDRGSFSRASSQSCGEQWLELDAYLPLDTGGGGTGTFTVQVGTCPESGCSYDDSGNYVPTEVYASAEIELDVGGS